MSQKGHFSYFLRTFYARMIISGNQTYVILSLCHWDVCTTKQFFLSLGGIVAMITGILGGGDICLFFTRCVLAKFPIGQVSKFLYMFFGQTLKKTSSRTLITRSVNLGQRNCWKVRKIFYTAVKIGFEIMTNITLLSNIFI